MGERLGDGGRGGHLIFFLGKLQTGKVTLDHVRIGMWEAGGWVFNGRGYKVTLSFGIFRRHELKLAGQGDCACCLVYNVKVTLDHVLISRLTLYEIDPFASQINDIKIHKPKVESFCQTAKSIFLGRQKGLSEHRPFCLACYTVVFF